MPPENENMNFSELRKKLRPGLAFVVMIFFALIAFEIFNYTTTDHALADLLGDLTFIGIPWSTILAMAFCGIDFAGIARLFTPEQGMDEPKEVWYLFGAWLLAATMNAILTWWGVSMAVVNHQVQSTALIDPKTLTNVVPVFVAVMVWVIRILIIGTLSLSMDRLMHADATAPQRPERSFFDANRVVPRPESGQAREPRASRANPEVTYPYPSSLGNNSYNQRPPASRAASAPNNRPSANRPGRSVPEPVEEDDLFGGESSSAPPARSLVEPSYHSLGSVSARPPVNSAGKKLN